jgi:Fe-S oxidoreductase
MATREEQHSTRGRANVLRLTMAGRLGETGLGDEGVYQTLDLCLECRACKSECPVGVDVARFKSEFLADYWERHGTPLQARALGNARALAEWGSRFAPMSNWLANSGPVKAMNESLLGIDRRRKLPQFQRRTLAKRTRSLKPAAGSPTVLLFNDTFTNHYDPEIGLAAMAVLRAAGHRPALAPNACCGRPQISKGLLDDARRMAARNTELLHDAAAAGTPLVFCEPSCLSAIREDAPALLPGEARRRAQTVASAAVLFEDFAARADLPLREGPKTVLLHGHCHQKSMGLVAPARALLSKIPGALVVDLDAGCCGMAGSFGYDRGHYDVSRAIGERKLFPAVRAKAPDAVVVAAGTSCRHQIADFTSERAVHPAILLRSLLST